MPRNWRFQPHDESQVRQLSRDLKISPLTAQVLISRGFTAKEGAVGFLQPQLNDLLEPDLLPGLADAADRIVTAVRDKRRITIYGDYDVDGVTATSILWHCLQLAGATVDYYIPSRLEEGYGINCDAIRQLHQEDPKRLLVSVDCGITSVKEAALARELGLDLLITDHHTMCETLPDAVGLVHPRLPGSDYPFPHLCGAGVAFKLAWGICQRLGDGRKASPQMREFLKSAVGLAAIGTVADVVPLLGENRIIVRYGLATLLERSTPGLKALLKVAGLSSNKTLDAEDIGFGIAPRINAAGRLGQARLAVELLTTDNTARAEALAEYLDQLNKNRRTVERRMLKQAKEIVAANPEWESHGALVIANEEWHPGVIGIVANRVAEHFQKPTILIAMESQSMIGQGSGRTFAGFDLHAALAACAEHLQSFGGHQAAAGLKIAAGCIDAFRLAFAGAVTQRNSEGGPRDDGALEIDAEVRLADVTHRAVNELNKLGPFGEQNRKPVFAATRVELVEPPRKMGEGDRHLSLKVKQYGTVLRAVAFGRGEWADEIAAARGPLSISFAPGINHFRGQENVELQLVDWIAESARDGVSNVQSFEDVAAR
ncbi:MAG: single-stranded-DNA-specific exonuclease RecJ [Planctomycetaceae bacterium]